MSNWIKAKWLVFQLGSRSSQTRQSAAMGLGTFRHQIGVQPLIMALADQADGVREAAARALGEIGNDRAVGALIGVLADVAPAVRQSTARALAQLGEDRWERAVNGTVMDFCRLGTCDDSRVVGPLIRLLEVFPHSDDDWAGKHEAIKGLANARDPRAADPLIKCALRWYQVKSDLVADALRKCGAADGAVAALCKSLDTVRDIPDYDHSVVCVVRLLSALGDVRAVESILRLLSKYGVPDSVKNAAIIALGELGDNRARPPLQEMLSRGGFDGQGSFNREYLRKAIEVALRKLETAGG